MHGLTKTQTFLLTEKETVSKVEARETLNQKDVEKGRFFSDNLKQHMRWETFKKKKKKKSSI